MITHCYNPIKLKDSDMYVPCGKCAPCRLARVQEWQTRLAFELKSWKFSAFITLTYDNEHLPLNKSLVKSDLQKFFKRLRKRIYPRKVKYFAVGEYGEENKRPHYHIILFGLDPLNNDDRKAVINSWQLCDSLLFEWRKKHNAIDVANVANIRYVSGYVQKKLYGGLAKEEYVDRIPPFSVSSQGLGLESFWKMPTDL